MNTTLDIQFIFCFPRDNTPTEEEMNSMEDYIIMFYNLRNDLSSFVLARA